VCRRLVRVRRIGSLFLQAGVSLGQGMNGNLLLVAWPNDGVIVKSASLFDGPNGPSDGLIPEMRSAHCICWTHHQFYGESVFFVFVYPSLRHRHVRLALEMDIPTPELHRLDYQRRFRHSWSLRDWRSYGLGALHNARRVTFIT
jgi:hypothetical protein